MLGWQNGKHDRLEHDRCPNSKDRFLSTYPEFLAEPNLEKKCRLLLDWFKMQIVFAGMFYDFQP